MRPLSVVIGLEGLALGGCPINALDLGRALRERGHRVDVFAIDEDVKVSLLPYAASRGFAPTILPTEAGILTRAAQIREVCAQSDADIVHVFGPWLGPAATVAAASRRGQSAVVTNWTMSNVYFTPRHTPMIVGTRALEADLRARTLGPVWLMEPPVDIVADAPDAARGRSFREHLGLGDHHLVAVVVGRVDNDMKAESLRHTIDAIGAIAEPTLRLVIVGDGDAKAEMDGRAASVNAALGWEAVLLPGPLQDPRPAYDAADIALGMGGSALRALAHGKPLIVLGVGGFACRFEASTQDFFYEQGFFGEGSQEEPVEHLATLIRSLWDPSERVQLGAHGLAEVGARFGLERMAERLEGIYEQTLKTFPARPRRLANAGYVGARTVAHQAKRALTGHA